MTSVVFKIDTKNRWLISAIGVFFFVVYLICLYFRPHESWCDDAFWADWARQLAVHNRYYTTVWGGGHPSYCPLYAFIMAVWYKIVGFGFFAAQFPNICLALVIYWLLSVILVRRKHIYSWQGILGFSVLFWLTPSMFWIYNCGRIEVLCLLLGVLTAYSFVRALEVKAIKQRIGLFLFSILLFATGVEGVVFATLFIMIHSAYNYREAWQHKSLYVWHFGGYVVSLGTLCVITWKVHCLHQFLDTMFGFSKTFTSLYLYLRAVIKGIKHGEVAENIPQVPTSKDSFIWSFVDGLTLNLEYLVLVVIMIILFVCLCYVVKWRNIQKSMLVITTMAIITPFVYILAGRYTLYYTWAAYIPCIIAIVILAEQLHAMWLHLGIGVIMTVFFCVYSGPGIINNVIHAHEKDKQNMDEIMQAQIDPNVATCIPYSWYYYIVEDNENIWFQASGAYPEDLSVIIYAPDDYNEEGFMNRYELQERCRIGDKIVYEVLSKKED